MDILTVSPTGNVDYGKRRIVSTGFKKVIRAWRIPNLSDGSPALCLFGSQAAGVVSLPDRTPKAKSHVIGPGKGELVATFSPFGQDSPGYLVVPCAKVDNFSMAFFESGRKIRKIWARTKTRFLTTSRGHPPKVWEIDVADAKPEVFEVELPCIPPVGEGPRLADSDVKVILYRSAVLDVGSATQGVFDSALQAGIENTRSAAQGVFDSALQAGIENTRSAAQGVFVLVNVDQRNVQQLDSGDVSHYGLSPCGQYMALVRSSNEVDFSCPGVAARKIAFRSNRVAVIKTENLDLIFEHENPVAVSSLCFSSDRLVVLGPQLATIYRLSDGESETIPLDTPAVPICAAGNEEGFCFAGESFWQFHWQRFGQAGLQSFDFPRPNWMHRSEIEELSLLPRKEGLLIQARCEDIFHVVNTVDQKVLYQGNAGVPVVLD
jgi:hypothetical protein